MSNKKQTYKERHGTTRIGDFLRSINIGKVAGVGVELLEGDLAGALKVITGGSDELSEEQRSYAIKLLELDIVESESVTRRWNSDLKYGNTLTRSVRPLTLIFLTISTVTGWYLGYNIDAMTNLLTIVLTAYFGMRTSEGIFGKKD